MNIIVISLDNPNYFVPRKTVDMSKKSNEILSNKYVPTYSDYFSRPWYEKDLMNYFNFLEYQEMAKKPTEYFKNKKIINFNTIHHEARVDPLQESYKNYQSVKKVICKDSLLWKEKKTVVGITQNIKHEDMYVEKSIIKEHFMN